MVLGIFRASSEWYEIMILYTTLLFFVLAQTQSENNLGSIYWNYLLLASILSTTSILFSLLSNFLIRFSKGMIRIIEETLNRIALGCFFVSVLILLLALFNLYEIGLESPGMIGRISLFIIPQSISSAFLLFLLVVFVVIIYTIIFGRETQPAPVTNTTTVTTTTTTTKTTTETKTSKNKKK